jgi:hypothetical protein
MWAGVALGALFVGCQSTIEPEANLQRPMPSKAVVSAERSVGVLGGQLEAGEYRLTIPPGALLSPVTITMRQEAAGEWPVILGPEGQRFLLPVSLSFDAESEADPQSMTVAWWNPSTGEWVDQLTVHGGASVSTAISHFSRYTIH